MTKVIVFSGGRGSSSLIKALKVFPNVELRLIVNAYDNGLSTGILRSIFEILGISDIRKNIGLLSFNETIQSVLEKRILLDKSTQIRNIFNIEINRLINSNNIANKEFIINLAEHSISLLDNYELPKDKYAFGNLLMVSIFCKKNINNGLDQFQNALGIKDRVILNSYDKLYLCALSSSGHLILDEADIVSGRSSISIDSIFLLKQEHLLELKSRANKISLAYVQKFLKINGILPTPSNAALEAINDSNLLIYAPGTPHSSLYPTYMTKKLGEIVQKSKCTKIFVCNIGADYETPSYKVSDYIKGTQKYLQNSGAKGHQNLIDYVLVNKSIITNRNEVVFDKEDQIFQKVHVIEKKLSLENKKGVHSESQLAKSLKRFFI